MHDDLRSFLSGFIFPANVDLSLCGCPHAVRFYYDAKSRVGYSSTISYSVGPVLRQVLTLFVINFNLPLRLSDVEND